MICIQGPKICFAKDGANLPFKIDRTDSGCQCQLKLDMVLFCKSNRRVSEDVSRKIRPGSQWLRHMLPHCGWRFDLQFPANHAGPPGVISLSKRGSSQREAVIDMCGEGEIFVGQNACHWWKCSFLLLKHLCSKVLYCRIYNILKLTVTALHVGWCTLHFSHLFTTIWRSCIASWASQYFPRMRSKAQRMWFWAIGFRIIGRQGWL